MRRSALTTLFAAITAAALVLSGCTASTEPDADQQSDEISYLWALGATDGSLVQSDTAMFLELTGVGAAVTRFSDRPAREASEVDVRDFLGRWEGRFAEVPPNAVLSYQADEGAAPVQLVVEISRPRYDEASSTLVFAAEVIDETPDELEGADHPVADHEPVIPARTGPVSLFIDSEGADAEVSEIATISAHSVALSAAVSDYQTAVAEGGMQDLIDSELVPAVVAQDHTITDMYAIVSILNRTAQEMRDSARANRVAALTPSDLALIDAYGVALNDSSTTREVDGLLTHVESELATVRSAQQVDLLRLQLESNANDRYTAAMTEAVVQIVSGAQQVGL